MTPLKAPSITFSNYKNCCLIVTIMGRNGGVESSRPNKIWRLLVAIYNTFSNADKWKSLSDNKWFWLVYLFQSGSSNLQWNWMGKSIRFRYRWWVASFSRQWVFMEILSIRKKFQANKSWSTENLETSRFRLYLPGNTSLLLRKRFSLVILRILLTKGLLRILHYFQTGLSLVMFDVIIQIQINLMLIVVFHH